MKPYTHQNVTHLIYDVMSYGLLIIFMLSARIIFHNNLNFLHKETPAVFSRSFLLLILFGLFIFIPENIGHIVRDNIKYGTFSLNIHVPDF